MIEVEASIRIMKIARIGKMYIMPASFLRSSEYIGRLSVHIGLTRNSVFISSRDLSSSSVSLISFVSDEEELENSSATSTPPRIDLTLELSSWFRLSIIWDLKGWRDWSIFHEMRFENEMSVLS